VLTPRKVYQDFCNKIGTLRPFACWTSSSAVESRPDSPGPKNHSSRTTRRCAGGRADGEVRPSFTDGRKIETSGAHQDAGLPPYFLRIACAFAIRAPRVPPEDFS
jgi:hypothetical protein